LFPKTQIAVENFAGMPLVVRNLKSTVAVREISHCERN